MKRNQAREIAVQLGFAAVAAGSDPQQTVEDFFAPEHYASMAAEGELYAEKPRGKTKQYILDSVTGVAEHAEELDALIEKYAAGWRTQRISRSAAAVLRQAMFEILYMPDIPTAVSINEAVEIARGYEDETVVTFINGVLGGFVRDQASNPAESEPAAETAAPAAEPSAE